MVAASRRRLLQGRVSTPTVLTTRRQQILMKNKLQSQTTQQIQKTIPRVEEVKINYDEAWKTALSHFDNNKAGAYLYHMDREAGTDPQIGAVYKYIKELVRQQKSGNISPSSSLLAKEKIQIEQTPKVDFTKVEYGKITYSPGFNTYYTRDQAGKLIVTSGIRGFDYLTEEIKGGGVFKRPSFRKLPDRKVPGSITVPPKSQLIASRVKITSSDIPNKLIVSFPNGQRGTISASGRVVVGSRLAGNKYIFQDGVIIAVDGKSTFARPEFIPTPTVQKIEQPTGIISSYIKKLNDYQKVKSTSSIRTKQKNLKNELKLLGVTTGVAVIAGVSAIIGLPSTIVSIVKKPSKLLGIPSAIKSGGISFMQLIRISPTEALGKIFGEIIFLKGSGSVFTVTGKVSSNAYSKLNPLFKKIEKGPVTIKTSAGKSQISLGTIDKGVRLTKQVRLAGKKLEVAASVQAERLINIFGKGRQKVVRKPIPGEDTLTSITKRLLEKFDSGTIGKADFIRLNKRLIKETGDKTLLERSLFLDPTGKVRFTRLGDEPAKAGILDILSGDFVFKTPKPQILVFTDVPVAKFPASLRDVAKKLKLGKALNEGERIRLVEWQLKTSGKLKPIGDIKYKGGKELEVTIAPGELIKRIKKIGTVVIRGKRVEVIEAKIFKPNPKVASKIKKANKGLLSKSQMRSLEKELERLTGFKSKSVRRSRGVRPKARIPKRVPRISRRPSKRSIKRALKKSPKRTIKRVGKRVVKRPPRVPAKRPPRVPAKRPPRVPAKRPPIIRGKPIKKFKKRTISKSQPVFYIKVKSKGRIVNLNPRPLILRDAKDYLAYKVDRGLIRTGYLKPIGKSKNVIRLPKNIQGYFKRNSKKLRPYKIRHGKKKELLNGYIEKKKYVGDTRSEILALRRARAKKKTIKRKKTVKKRRK